ncbi:hypothetical protein BaRGS_00016951 [Batillaria attramentaria]|uniref:Transposase n=1 Tax=Batillaria attramentaria TaxID=370345 RepID=A0ABD0KWZ2_9CAEN|nr:hypothetical protein BaRGS_023403 [Batillaria attramentaria]
MSTKRFATSPLYDTNEKRSCLDEQDGSFMADTDSDDTIVNPDYLSSTLVDPNESAVPEQKPDASLKDQIQEAFSNPALIEAISKAVAARVSSELRAEMVTMRESLEKKDRQILHLQDRVDELEQYSRRNNIRISDIPEIDGEDTDDLIIAIGNEIGVTITEEMIDRSHRVGKKGDDFCRPIICKFTSYRYKQRLLKEKKKLANVDAKQLFPERSWHPRRTRQRPSSTTRAEPKIKIYLNDDLTKTRAEIASKARKMKSDGALQDTWVRDGVIFVRQNSTTHRVTTARELAVFG